MNNWKEILESRLKTCNELIDDAIDFDALSEIEYFDKIEKFLNLESALLQSLLNNLEILKPNESKTVNRNENAEKFCAYCGKRKKLKGDGTIEKLCEC